MREMIYVLLVVVIVALIVWAINSFLPIDARFKQLITVIAVVAVVIYLIFKFLLPLIPA